MVRYVDTHYRTIPDRRYRALMGISEDGYGAVNLTLKHHDEFGVLRLKHHDEFGVAVSIGGYFTAPSDEVFGLASPFDHDAPLVAANNPMTYVRLHGPRDVRLLIADNPKEVLPLDVGLGSRTLTVVAGFALIMVDRGLARGKRHAWMVAFPLLLSTAVLHLVKDLDVEQAIVALLLTAVLWLRRQDYQAGSDAPSLRRGCAALALGVALATGYSFGSVPLAQCQLSWMSSCASAGLKWTPRSPSRASSTHTWGLVSAAPVRRPHAGP